MKTEILSKDNVLVNNMYGVHITSEVFLANYTRYSL